MKRATVAALAAVAILASPAWAQAPAGPAISPEAMQAAQALSAYQRGQTMQRNAAQRLCNLGQPTYCAEAAAPSTTGQATAPAAPVNPPNTGAPARR